eukprot:scaffold86339_cov27-Phaeocystis_antarctica.AAC.1
MKLLLNHEMQARAMARASEGHHELRDAGADLGTNVSFRAHDRVGISGPTGDLGTTMAWLRPVALLQSSPPFGD